MYAYVCLCVCVCVCVCVGALRRDILVLDEALAAALEEKAQEPQLKKLKELRLQILSDFDKLSEDLATPAKISL